MFHSNFLADSQMNSKNENLKDFQCSIHGKLNFPIFHRHSTTTWTSEHTEKFTFSHFPLLFVWTINNNTRTMPSGKTKLSLSFLFVANLKQTQERFTLEMFWTFPLIFLENILPYTNFTNFKANECDEKAFWVRWKL